MKNKIKNALAVMVVMIGTSSNLALAADWQFDLNKTQINFETPPGGMAQVTGQFQKFDGQIKGDVFDQKNIQINFTVESNSVATGSRINDGVIKGSSLFNVEKYPTINFKSTSVKQIDPAHVIVQGDLTMLGVTKSIKTKVTLDKPRFDPTTKVVSMNATADLVIRRSEWGMTGYSSFVGNDIAVHTTGVLISNNVTAEDLAKVMKAK